MKIMKVTILIESKKNLSLKGLQRPTPFHGQGHLPVGQAFQNPIQAGPESLDTL